MTVIKTANTKEELEQRLKEVNYRIQNYQRVFDKTKDNPEYADTHEDAVKKLKELDIEKKNIEVQLQGVRSRVRKEVVKPIVKKVIQQSLAAEFLTGKPGETGWYFPDRGNAPGNIKFYGPFKEKIVATIFMQVYAGESEGNETKFFGQEDADTAAKTEGFMFLFPDQADWNLNGQPTDFNAIVMHVRTLLTKTPKKQPKRRIVRPTEKPKPEKIETPKEEELDPKEARVQELEAYLEQKEKEYFAAESAYSDYIMESSHKGDYDEEFEDDEFEDDEFEDDEGLIGEDDEKLKELKKKSDQAQAEYERAIDEIRPQIIKLRNEISAEKRKSKHLEVESKLEDVRSFEDAIDAIRAEIKVEKTPQSIMRQVELSERALYATRNLILMVKKQYAKEEDEAVARSTAELKFEYDRIQDDLYLLKQYLEELNERQKTVDELQTQYIELKQEDFVESLDKTSEEYMGAFEAMFESSIPELDMLDKKKKLFKRKLRKITDESERAEIKKTIKLIDSGIARITNAIISKKLSEQQPKLLLRYLHSDRLSDKRGDTVYNYILRIAANYLKLKQDTVNLVKDLQHKSERIKQGIKRKMSKEEWKDFKRTFGRKQRIETMVFVRDIKDFITNFDPALGGSPKRPFYFHYDFIKNRENVDLLHSYLLLYYSGQPVWPVIAQAGIDTDEISGAAETKLKAERVNKEHDSIIDVIARKVGRNPDEAQEFAREKFSELIHRIFRVGIIDPEDRNYQYEDEIAMEEGRRTPVLFRTINQNFDGYITTALRNDLLDGRSKMPLREIKCPYRDCSGKVIIRLKEGITDQQRRNLLEEWRRGEAFINKDDPDPQLSKCNECHRPIAGRFVNCPNCLSAVPISSTTEAWFDYGLAVGDKAEYKDPDDPQMEEFSHRYAKKINKIFDAHVNQNNNREKAQTFLKAFFDYYKQLKRTYELNPDSEIVANKMQKASDIVEVFDRMPPEMEEGSIYDLKKLFAGMYVQKEFEELLTSYLSRGHLFVLSFEEIAQMGKISRLLRKKKLNEVFEKIGANPFLSKEEKRFYKVAVRGISNLKYKSLDYNTLCFDYDMQLVCPHCLFGINGEFNPANLAHVSLARVANREGEDEKKILNRKELAKIEDKGILIGNTPGCDVDITSQFGAVPRERQSKYRVLVKRFRNAGFKVTNLADAPVFVGVQKKNKIYRGKSITVSSGGTITFDRNVIYKLHCGIFFVQPNMFTPSYVEQTGRENQPDGTAGVGGESADFLRPDQIEDELIERIDMRRMSEDQQKEMKKKVVDNEENKVVVDTIVDAYCIRLNSDQDMTFAKYLASIRDGAERQQEYDRIMTIRDDMFRNAGVLQDGSFAYAALGEKDFEYLMDRLIEEIIPDGANQHEKRREEFKKFMRDWVKLHFDKENSKLLEKKIEVDREKMDDKMLERAEENKEKIEQDVDEREAELMQRLEFSISETEGEHTAPLKDFIRSAAHIYQQEGLAGKDDVFKSYIPPEEPIMDSNFLDVHMMINYRILTAYKALLKVLSQVPESVAEGSTIAFSGPGRKPEEYKGRFSTHVDQVNDALNRVMVLKDDVDIDTDLEKMLEEKKKVGSLAQAIMEYASMMMIDMMHENPELLKAKRKVRKLRGGADFDKDVKVKELEKGVEPATALHVSPMLGALVFKNTHSLGKYQKFEYKIPISQSAIVSGVNILAHPGQKENLVEGNEDKIGALRGTVYISKDLGFREGDMVDISVYMMSYHFFRRVASSIIGSIAKDVFGDDFDSAMPSVIPVKAGALESFYFNDVIYKIGLDQKLQEIYDAIRSGNDVVARKQQLKVIRKRYETVIRRLTKISLQMIAQEKGEEATREIYGDYRYTLSKIPPEKAEEFWKIVQAYVMGGRMKPRAGGVVYEEARNFDQFESVLRDTFGLTGGASRRG